MNAAPLASFKGRHEGQTALVCGCGPSLNELMQPERFTTIGVNDVGRLFDPTYLVVVNPRSQFKDDRFRYVEQSNAQTIFTQLDLGPLRAPVSRFRLGRYGGTDVPADDTLHYTQNSPYVAVCLAAHMGATRIGLIGVDFTDHHFFAPTGRHSLAGRLRVIDAEYGRLGAALKQRGIELVNLSAASRLTSLPKLSLSGYTGAAAPMPAVAQATPSSGAPRVFFVNYLFIACGDVFAKGLEHAAQSLGLEWAASWWNDPALAAKLRAFQPDLVFAVHGRHFAPIWRQLKREFPRAKSAVWLTEEPYEVDDSARWSRVFDTVFVNDPSTLSRHVNAHALPVCFDPVTHRDAGAQRPYFAGFIGAPSPTRERFLLPLAEAGLLDYVVGGPWKAQPLQRLCLAAMLPPAETAALYQRSSVVLNVFRDRHHFNAQAVPAQAMNPRVYEALACGALVVSQPRPELCEVLPELPTFTCPQGLVDQLRELSQDRPRLQRLLDASRARLGEHHYTSRLRKAMDIAMQTAHATTSLDAMAPRAAAPQEPVQLAGWRSIGSGCTVGSGGAVSIRPQAGQETGLASTLSLGSARLRAMVRMSVGCQFIAKLRHATCGEPAANSYHLVSLSSTRSYLARHHQMLVAVPLPRGRWFRLEVLAQGISLRICIDGREVARSTDDTLAEGYAFIGACAGLLEVKELSVHAVEPVDAAALLADWTVQGTGVQAAGAAGLLLCANGAGPTSITSRATYNDVELEFDLTLSAQASFSAALHQQPADETPANPNAYRLVASGQQGVLGRHDHPMGKVQLSRSRRQRVLMRWVDQQLSVSVDGRVALRTSDNLLQSGHCSLAVKQGSAEINCLVVRDLANTSAPGRMPAAAAARHKPVVATALPFGGMPRRNLMYHVWPVRNSAWRWNVERLLRDIDLFNGRRIIGIAHDGMSEPPAAVRACFEGHGCEFIEVPNDPRGECLTFPLMLERVASQDPADVTFYGHAKGV